jgi:hypothetical protein
MDANRLISIARQGNRLGQFPLAAVRAGLLSGKFTNKDHYWSTGMTNWESLDQLPKEEPMAEPAETEMENPVEQVISAPAIIQSVPQSQHAPKAQSSPAPVPTLVPPPPPLPIQLPSDWRKTASTILLTIGVVEFLYGLTTSPDGSAIRQQVLVQHMTNGLLFAILSLMVRKFN